jgi:hypothetical protein
MGVEPFGAVGVTFQMVSSENGDSLQDRVASVLQWGKFQLACAVVRGAIREALYPRRTFALFLLP